MTLLRVVQGLIVLYAFGVGFEHVDVFRSGGTFTVPKFVGILLAGIFCLHLSTQRLGYVRKIYVTSCLPIIAFALLLTIQNMLNFNSFSETTVDVPFILNVFVFIILIRCLSTEPVLINRCLYAFLVGSFISSLTLILGIGVDVNSDGRHTIFAANHNELAFKFVVGFVVCLSIFEVSRKRLLKVVCVPALLLLVLGIALTGSRAAILSVLLVVLIFVFSNSNVSSATRVSVVGALALVVAFQLASSAELVARYALATTVQGGENDVLGGRIIIWTAIYHLIQLDPIFGIGRSGYEHAIYLALGEVLNPHNVILESLLYTGAFGTLILGSFFLRLWRISSASYSVYSDKRSIYLLVPLVLMITSQQIFAIKVFWLISAIIFSIYFSKMVSSD